MNIRKYESIPNIYKVSNKFLNVGDLIHVSEKIDGANASFRKSEDGKLHFYSRNNKLGNEHGLRGFVEWCNKNIDADKIRTGFIFYGEWVVRHKINYTSEIANTFVLFDIYDVEANKYITPKAVEVIANNIGLKTPKKLYDGEYLSLEHLQQFVGVGEYCDKGEGIVIRNWSNSTICKWVRADFREEKAIKQPKVQKSELVDLFDQLCTDARVEKILYKGLDDEVYNSFDKVNFGSIMKYCGNNVAEDIIKENSDIIPTDTIDEFVKYVKSKTPVVVRKVLTTIEL